MLISYHILSYLLISSGCWLECIRCCLKSWRRSFGLLIMVWQPSPGARNDDIFFWSKLSPSNPWWSYFDQNDHPSKWSKLQNIKCFTQMTRIEMVQTNIWTIWWFWLCDYVFHEFEFEVLLICKCEVNGFVFCFVWSPDFRRWKYFTRVCPGFGLEERALDKYENANIQIQIH